MFERNIYDNYGLFCEERYMINDYEGFTSKNERYVFINANHEKDEEITVKLKMVDFLIRNGEKGIAQLIQTVDGRKKSLIDGQEGYVMKIPSIPPLTGGENFTDGALLALFHASGEGFYYQYPKGNLFYFGKWKEIWEQRLDQLERWYEQVLQYRPQTEVDDLFVTTFPYYLALSENAIQYVVDTTIDYSYRVYNEEPVICHKQYTEQTWLTVSEQHVLVKLPSDFIIDHRSRDIAEWIRGQLLSNFSIDKVTQFLADYEMISPLSDYSWRLLYARLLFPLHYFVAIEKYYANQIIEQRPYLESQILQTIEQEDKNEKMLKALLQKIRTERKVNIPEVEWLLNI